jgi:putative endonuclease
MSPAIPPRFGAAASRPSRGGSAGRALGALGERLAAEHMERLGFAILARNVRTRAGEIDLIAFDGRTLVFAEVKTSAARGTAPAAAVLERLAPRQRARLRGLAAAWLCEHPERPRAAAIRLDAVGVSVDSGGRLTGLEHIEAAW